jgi:hypothetical protein
VKCLTMVATPKANSYILHVAVPVLLMAFAFLSCSDERCCCPQAGGPKSGRVVLHDLLLEDNHTPFLEGFSFPEARVIRMPNEDSIVPDIIAVASTDVLGHPVEMNFIQPLAAGFSYVGTRATESDGRLLFDTLSCVDDSVRFSVTFAVRPYQVYVVKTHEGKFAKVLVLGTYFFESQDERYHGQVTFDWVYQPDGGRCFK